MKNTAGSGEEETVKAVENGEGGYGAGVEPRDKVVTLPQRANGVVGNPLGSVLPLLGASEGRGNSWEDCRYSGHAVASKPRANDEEAVEVLEGECKVMSGVKVVRVNLPTGCLREYARAHIKRA